MLRLTWDQCFYIPPPARGRWRRAWWCWKWRQTATLWAWSRTSRRSAAPTKKKCLLKELQHWDKHSGRERLTEVLHLLFHCFLIVIYSVLYLLMFIFIPCLSCCLLCWWAKDSYHSDNNMNSPLSFYWQADRQTHLTLAGADTNVAVFTVEGVQEQSQTLRKKTKSVSEFLSVIVYGSASVLLCLLPVVWLLLCPFLLFFLVISFTICASLAAQSLYFKPECFYFFYALPDPSLPGKIGTIPTPPMVLTFVASSRCLSVVISEAGLTSCSPSVGWGDSLSSSVTQDNVGSWPISRVDSSFSLRRR